MKKFKIYRSKYFFAGVTVSTLMRLSSPVAFGAPQSSVAVPVPGSTTQAGPDGPQLFFDARTTGFTKDGKQQVFDGDVIAIGPRSIITADKVILDQLQHRFVAEGHVVVIAGTQILTGEKIEYLLDTGDFKIDNAMMVVNDGARVGKISNEVLGFSIPELEFESQRKARLSEIGTKKDTIKQDVRRKAKLGIDASYDDIQLYSRYLQQEDLITKQVNPAFAHMTESRRNTLKKRRDFWEQAKMADKLPSSGSQSSYFRLEGDNLTRSNGNDYRAKHSLFTPCKCDDDETPAWGIRAAQTDAQIGGYATFSDAMIEIKGVPVLYLPWFKIPIKDKRQSGMLPPSFTSSKASGNGYSQPLFLDLGPNKDVTIKADNFDRRGLRAGTEFRYKHTEYSGLKLNLEGMEDRVWMRQRATRQTLTQMYTDGLATAVSNHNQGKADTDPSQLSGKEYTRTLLSDWSWWNSNQKNCLSTDGPTQAACLNPLLSPLKTPNNSTRGLVSWRGNERLGPRVSFVTTGDLVSDRQYNADTYLPDSISTSFESGNGERTVNPIRTRFNYDGDNYFLGAGSFYGDNTQTTKNFEGYQLPMVIQSRSKWFLVSDRVLPIYTRIAAEEHRITKNPAVASTSNPNMLPGGHWQRAELSLSTPLTSRTAVQVDQFTDFEARYMTYDGVSSMDHLDRRSTMQSWKTGFRFQLPIDGKGALPSWLGGLPDESGQRVLQHIMNWTMTLAVRPTVVRRGPYGEALTPFTPDPGQASTWYQTDRAGSDDNINAMDYMSEYQLVTFGTTHRWKILNRLWNTLLGSESENQQQISAKLTFEERARRELLYSLDRPIHSADDMFSNDQQRWFSNRYQLLESDYLEPANFSASINYDRLKDIKRHNEGATLANRPWGDLYSTLGLSASGWSLVTSSDYNIYDRNQVRLAFNLGPPGFLKSNVSFGYTIDHTPQPVDSSGTQTFTSVKESSLSFSTSLLNPFNVGYSYSRKEQDVDPAYDVRHKITVIFASRTGCWGMGFSREKPYGNAENAATYLLSLNISFMGQNQNQETDISNRVTQGF